MNNKNKILLNRFNLMFLLFLQQSAVFCVGKIFVSEPLDATKAGVMSINNNLLIGYGHNTNGTHTLYKMSPEHLKGIDLPAQTKTIISTSQIEKLEEKILVGCKMHDHKIKVLEYNSKEQLVHTFQPDFLKLAPCGKQIIALQKEGSNIHVFQMFPGRQIKKYESVLTDITEDNWEPLSFIATQNGSNIVITDASNIYIIKDFALQHTIKKRNLVKPRVLTMDQDSQGIIFFGEYHDLETKEYVLFLYDESVKLFQFLRSKSPQIPVSNLKSRNSVVKVKCKSGIQNVLLTFSNPGRPLPVKTINYKSNLFKPSALGDILREGFVGVNIGSKKGKIFNWFNGWMDLRTYLSSQVLDGEFANNAELFSPIFDSKKNTIAGIVYSTEKPGKFYRFFLFQNYGMQKIKPSQEGESVVGVGANYDQTFIAANSRPSKEDPIPFVISDGESLNLEIEKYKNAQLFLKTINPLGSTIITGLTSIPSSETSSFNFLDSPFLYNMQNMTPLFLKKENKYLVHQVLGTSHCGRAFVGISGSLESTVATLWSKEKNGELKPNYIPANSPFSQAIATSWNGEVVVGLKNLPFSFRSMDLLKNGFEAKLPRRIQGFIWKTHCKKVKILNGIEKTHNTIPAAISLDGKTIVGNSGDCASVWNWDKNWSSPVKVTSLSNQISTSCCVSDDGSIIGGRVQGQACLWLKKTDKTTKRNNSSLESIWEHVNLKTFLFEKYPDLLPKDFNGKLSRFDRVSWISPDKRTIMVIGKSSKSETTLEDCIPWSTWLITFPTAIN